VRTEFTLARAVVLLRVAGLVEIGIVTGQNASSFRGHGAEVTGLLAAVIAAESILLCTACLRARRVRPWWAVADLAFTIAVLAASAMVTARYGGLYVAYPYLIICSLAFGVALRRLSAVLVATVFLVAGYLYGGGHLHADPAAHVAVNCITYFPNTVVTWAVSRQLRRMGRELDASRSREAMLARDQERLRHAWMLHDRVLQTMETLAVGQWIADAALKARVAEEAVWLRGLVEGADQRGQARRDDQRGAPARRHAPRPSSSPCSIGAADSTRRYSLRAWDGTEGIRPRPGHGVGRHGPDRHRSRRRHLSQDHHAPRANAFG
jgi:hypothetical protein